MIKFSGLKQKDIKDNLKASVFLGKVHNQNNVYFSSIETPDLTIIATIDVDRGVLIEALKIEHPIESNVKITSRNIGNTFNGTIEDIIKLKGEKNQEQKEKLMDEFRTKIENRYIKEEGTATNLLSSLFFTQVAYAGYGDVCTNFPGSNACSWVSVPYCAAAGLLGFWPGLVCAAGYTLICSHGCQK